MSTTATVDANEGWSFTNTEEAYSETEYDNNWGIPANATTTDGWNAPPPAPSPPLSAGGQPCANDNTSLHLTACYNDYCGAHRQMKDDNYCLQRGNDRRRRNHRPCSCSLAHSIELAEVIRNQHLNPCKACVDWQKGKRICPECQFHVNMENHHLRCSAAAPRNPLANVTSPQEDQEAAQAGHAPDPAIDPFTAATMTAALQDEQLTLLGEIITMIHQTTTWDARRNHVVQWTLAQRMNEFHDADQQQLQQMTNILGAIITEQQRMNEELQARPQASRSVRIYRTRIRRRTLTTQHDLAGASVRLGDALS